MPSYLQRGGLWGVAIRVSSAIGAIQTQAHSYHVDHHVTTTCSNDEEEASRGAMNGEDGAVSLKEWDGGANVAGTGTSRYCSCLGLFSWWAASVLCSLMMAAYGLAWGCYTPVIKNRVSEWVWY